MKNTLIKATLESGRILKENFGCNFKISSKDVVSNLVTEIDKKSEEKIFEIIKQDFPGHYILSEEVRCTGAGV
ncbi:MAG: inositol monophosphatase family protein [Ignavibacteria bacterium]